MTQTLHDLSVLFFPERLIVVFVERIIDILVIIVFANWDNNVVDDQSAVAAFDKLAYP
jgi:hypothetical protein